MENENRTDFNKRNEELENCLIQLNNFIEKYGIGDLISNEELKYNPIFIVGCARSGTTLINQWLANTGLFSYPSNLMSRFYKSPYLGALIHKILIDLDFKNEIFDNNDIKFTSVLGKTKGAKSPHEFWYFWREHFKFHEIQKLNDIQRDSRKYGLFKSQIVAIENVFDKPVLMKAMILNWDLDFLSVLFPNAIFLHVQRDIMSNMHSLFNARKFFFNNYNEWYSFKPPEYHKLMKHDVYIQLAGQVILTNNAVQKCLEYHPRYLQVDFNDFCMNPQKTFQHLSTLSNSKKILKTKSEEKFYNKSIATKSEFNKSKANEAIKYIYNNFL